MNAVAFGNWEMQAGDPGGFAFRLAFLPNPHGSDDRATEDDRQSLTPKSAKRQPAPSE